GITLRGEDQGVHGYLRELLELEVTAALGGLRYGRQAGAKGQRNGHRKRELIRKLPCQADTSEVELLASC
ncbi:MAG: hypothetical protein WB784_02235, partial [Rhodanobacteraceae bacterium]